MFASPRQRSWPILFAKSTSCEMSPRGKVGSASQAEMWTTDVPSITPPQSKLNQPLTASVHNTRIVRLILALLSTILGVDHERCRNGFARHLFSIRTCLWVGGHA